MLLPVLLVVLGGALSLLVLAWGFNARPAVCPACEGRVRA